MSSTPELSPRRPDHQSIPYNSFDINTPQAAKNMGMKLNQWRSFEWFCKIMTVVFAAFTQIIGPWSVWVCLTYYVGAVVSAAFVHIYQVEGMKITAVQSTANKKIRASLLQNGSWPYRGNKRIEWIPYVHPKLRELQQLYLGTIFQPKSSKRMARKRPGKKSPLRKSTASLRGKQDGKENIAPKEAAEHKGSIQQNPASLPAQRAEQKEESKSRVSASLASNTPSYVSPRTGNGRKIRNRDFFAENYITFWNVHNKASKKTLFTAVLTASYIDRFRIFNNFAVLQLLVLVFIPKTSFILLLPLFVSFVQLFVSGYIIQRIWNILMGEQQKPLFGKAFGAFGVLGYEGPDFSCLCERYDRTKTVARSVRDAQSAARDAQSAAGSDERPSGFTFVDETSIQGENLDEWGDHLAKTAQARQLARELKLEGHTGQEADVQGVFSGLNGIGFIAASDRLFGEGAPEAEEQGFDIKDPGSGFG